MKRLVPLLVAVVSVGAMVTGIALQSRQRARAQVVFPATEGFTLDQVKGQIALVNVWATWCPPCRREIPTLLGIADAYEAKGVRFVAVNADEGDRSVVEAFVHAQPESLRAHLAYPSDDFLQSIHLQGLPTTLILDKQGRVVKRFVGEIQPDDVRAALDAALAQGNQATR